MKPSISFSLKTLVIVAVATGLALAFNATRPHSLPLVRTADQERSAPRNAEIPLAEALRLFESGQALFLDARDGRDYAAGHIQGALSLTLMSFSQTYPLLRDRLEGKTLITYCDGEQCELSRDLADQLMALGMGNVVVFKNGWSLWLEAGLPTATTDASTEPGNGGKEPGPVPPGEAQPGAPVEGTTEPGGAAPSDVGPTDLPPTAPVPDQPVPAESLPDQSVPTEPAPAGPESLPSPVQESPTPTSQPQEGQP